MAVTDFSSRLKREDCKRTKHDSVFSEWKILIGPSDWENHSLSKNGIERYRIHNLPISSCPGIYELGIAIARTNLGRDVRKLDQDSIIAVYLGQSDNVRTRLQDYGRAGSHLDHGNSVGYPLDVESYYCFQKGPGLFREIFSKGFPIVFRWAQTKNKREAEKTEAQLLDIFDYAWNKGGNGARRDNDILLKLNSVTSSTIYFPNIARKLQHCLWDLPFGQKQEGIRITASTPPVKETKSSTCNDLEGSYLHSRIFKFGRSQPRLVSDKCGVSEEYTNICGVTLGDGSVCERTPIGGRKRCGEHKGMRANASFSRSVTEGNLLICGVGLEDGSVCVEVPVRGRKRCELHKGRRVSTSHIIPEGKVFKEENITFSGVALGYGSVCKTIPIVGRKRCEEHKGKRINGYIYRSVNEGKSVVCGVGLEDGSICMEAPVHGRKRCELHKGRRVSN